ncbi:hypothetical protein HYU93_03410 [Candidatus Daviesbacteria bacterium]|nr:hypothetical protein [Candidatus Daviesbacteria bacterium]
MKVIIYFGFLMLIFPQNAYAYLDPGTGSYLFQILMAGLLGSLFFIKSIIRKLKNLFYRFFQKRNTTQ